MTLGQVLKNKRLELGKSIEQIATATRIHVKVLRAIEEDHYGDLPARAFTRGFIISYCRALQLNSDQILRDYHDFLESKFAERPEKDHGHHGYAFEGKETEQNKRWMIISASVAAFFAILTLLFFKPQNHKHKEKHKELIAEEAEMIAMNPTPTLAPIPVGGNTPPPAVVTGTSFAVVTATPSASATTSPTPTVVPTAKPVTSPTPIASSTPTVSPTPKEDPLNKGDGILPKDVGLKVVLIALEDTIVHYHSDQRKPFSIMLRKDKQLVIKATNIIKFQTEHPETLKYRFSYKNKAPIAYSELKQSRLEFHPDGIETTFNAGSL